MTQITHRLDDGVYRQIVTPTTLRSVLDAAGSDYSVAASFADACAGTNPRFNRSRFLAACNLRSDD